MVSDSVPAKIIRQIDDQKNVRLGDGNLQPW